MYVKQSQKFFIQSIARAIANTQWHDSGEDCQQSIRMSEREEGLLNLKKGLERSEKLCLFLLHKLHMLLLQFVLNVGHFHPLKIFLLLGGNVLVSVCLLGITLLGIFPSF